MAINVYYLDDEEDLCEIFHEFFHSDDIHITTFSEPEKAIEVIKQTPPDLFFIDYRLPGITGDKVALMIDKNIPKIIVTGDLSIKTEYEFEEKIAKPYQFSNIQTTIERYKK